MPVFLNGVPADITIVEHSFQQHDLEVRLAALHLDIGTVGAVVTFMGQVRVSGDRQGVTGLVLEHYSGMTERVLQQHIAEACARWSLLGVVVVHRVGAMALGENIVGVTVASAHRQEAFDAIQFLMDFLKQDAPFWKQEVTLDGVTWVEQKQDDIEKARRW